jgi:transglutaminase-like putative cysteine protease
MARAAGTSARTHRLIALAAALLLAAATALSFGRVFLGASTTLKLLATASAAACLAALLERRSLLLATVVSAAGGAIAVGLVVFPDTTWYGLPTGETLRATLDAAALVGEQARIQVAPAEPIPPLLLAAVVSLWAAVFSAHALAFRAGSPLLGIIPPVALVAFADTVLEDFVKPLYGVAFLAAALLVVFADGLSRVQGWGPVWSSARRGVALTAGRGARRLALTALAAATLSPLFVPGFGSQAVIDFGASAGDRVSIDPFVSVRSQLSRRDPVEVLQMDSPRPTYLRLVSLPDFDGATWRPEQEDTGIVVAPGVPVPAVVGTFGGAETVTIDVTHDLEMPWLPTPYPLTSIQLPGTPIRYEPASGTAFLDDALEEGDSYAVEAAFVQPKAEDLRRIGFPVLPPDDRYLALPDAMPPEIRELALDWTEGQTNVFDRAMAIQERLRDTSEFRYEEDTAARAGTQTILEFLTVTKAGFCQQFATSMAVLLRSLDIPARVVVGFSDGVRDPRTGRYSITTDRAHSWVEVRFPGWGWLPFEPTPSRQNPVTIGYTTPTGEACEGPDCPGGGGGEGAGAEAGGIGPLDRAFEQDPRAAGPRARRGGAGPIAPAEGRSGITVRRVLVAGAILVAVILLIVPPARAVRRRVRLRRAGEDPRRVILVTYELFTERAAGLGLGRGVGETLEEYRRKVTDSGYLSNGHLDRLTTLATAAAYSSREPDRPQAHEAADAAETAIREIRRAVGPTRWLVGLYRQR